MVLAGKDGIFYQVHWSELSWWTMSENVCVTKEILQPNPEASHSGELSKSLGLKGLGERAVTGTRENSSLGKGLIRAVEFYRGTRPTHEELLLDKRQSWGRISMKYFSIPLLTSCWCLLMAKPNQKSAVKEIDAVYTT